MLFLEGIWKQETTIGEVIFISHFRNCEVIFIYFFPLKL